MLCVLCTSIDSYHRSECMIAQDVNQTLKQVLLNMPDNVVKTRQRLHLRGAAAVCLCSLSALVSVEVKAEGRGV